MVKHMVSQKRLAEQLEERLGTCLGVKVDCFEEFLHIIPFSVYLQI
jgi:hypothetical protein